MDENHRNLWRQITSKRSKNIFSNTFFQNGGVSRGNNNKVTPSTVIRRSEFVPQQRELLEVANFAHDEVSYNEEVTPVMDAATYDMARLGDYPTDDKQPKEIVNVGEDDYDDFESEEFKTKFEAESEELDEVEDMVLKEYPELSILMSDDSEEQNDEPATNDGK